MASCREPRDRLDSAQQNLITFIGPKLQNHGADGREDGARRIAIKAKVPVVPGIESPLKDDGEAKAVAERIGLPIVLKAAAGGGGKGIRLVQRAEDLSSAFRDTQSRPEPLLVTLRCIWRSTSSQPASH